LAEELGDGVGGGGVVGEVEEHGDWMWKKGLKLKVESLRGEEFTTEVAEGRGGRREEKFKSEKDRSVA
jgi:hypothetical protein